jgi:hypothetical protein
MRFGVCARSDYTGGWQREGALPLAPPLAPAACYIHGFMWPPVRLGLLALPDGVKRQVPAMFSSVLDLKLP